MSSRMFPLTILAIILTVIANLSLGLLKLTTSTREQIGQKIGQGTVSTLQTNKELCHFEDARGFFRNGWAWVADKEGNNCSVVDLVTPLLTNSSLPIEESSSSSSAAAFVFIGDSLDGHIVEHLCSSGASNLQQLPPRKEWPENPSLVNRARWKNAMVCRNDKIAFAFFAIHGMHHPCENPPYLKRVETRHFNTTAERIEKLLPVDTLSRLPEGAAVHVLVSSSLWDLSVGCNSQLGVSAMYQELYREGILAIHQVLRKLLILLQPNNSPVVYWRTSPPVTIEYDALVTKAGKGRNRGNQDTLNQILRKTVADQSLGVIVDWARQLQGVNETFLTNDAVISPNDGRHYKPQPGMAFFNLWLNSIYGENASQQQKPTKSFTSQ